MDKYEILLELNRISGEKFKMDPKEKLRPILKEMKSIKTAVEVGLREQEEYTNKAAAAEKETMELRGNLPKLTVTIARGKERMALVKGMTLKEMLSIQQTVAKAEESIQQSKAMMERLQYDREEYLAEARKAGMMVSELKRQYNEKIKVYQKEKDQIELQFAALLSKEEALKEDLGPKLLRIFQEAARAVPVNPVAVLRNGYCSGCRVEVSGQMARLVAQQSENLQHCDNCRRILLPASAIKSSSDS